MKSRSIKFNSAVFLGAFVFGFVENSAAAHYATTITGSTGVGTSCGYYRYCTPTAELKAGAVVAKNEGQDKTIQPVAELDEKIEEPKNEFSVESVETALYKYRRHDEPVAELSELKITATNSGEYSKIVQSQADSSTEVEKLKSELAEVSSKLSKELAKNSDAEEQIKSLNNTVSSQKETIESLTKENNELKAVLECKTKEVENLNNKLAEKTKECFGFVLLVNKKKQGDGELAKHLYRLILQNKELMQYASGSEIFAKGLKYSPAGKGLFGAKENLSFNDKGEFLKKIKIDDKEVNTKGSSCKKAVYDAVKHNKDVFDSKKAQYENEISDAEKLIPEEIKKELDKTPASDASNRPHKFSLSS